MVGVDAEVNSPADDTGPLGGRRLAFPARLAKQQNQNTGGGCHGFNVESRSLNLSNFVARLWWFEDLRTGFAATKILRKQRRGQDNQGLSNLCVWGCFIQDVSSANFREPNRLVKK